MKKFLSLLTLTLLGLGIPLVHAGSFALLKYGDEGETPYVEITGAPGVTVSGKFVLRNDSEIVNTYNVDIVDSTTADDGVSFALKDSVETQTEMGAWGSLSSDSITVQPGQYEIMEVFFDVPETAVVGNVYWGGLTGIVAEDPAAQDGGSSGAASVIRNALRVSLTIVAADEYVPPVIEDESVFGGDENSASQYGKYLIPGILILAAALIMAVNKRSEMSSGGGKITKGKKK